MRRCGRRVRLGSDAPGKRKRPHGRSNRAAASDRRCRQSNSSIPVVQWIKGQATQAAAIEHTRLLKPLFVGVVTQLAQRLPVRLVPEQLQIHAVRHLVVDYCGNDHTPELTAHGAQRIQTQVFTALLAPPMAIKPPFCTTRLNLFSRLRHRQPQRKSPGTVRNQGRTSHNEMRGHTLRSVCQECTTK